ncbi:MAG TPA: GNAT family N-acetyltransferase [Cyclobacteriaceae bacterium]|nr:GNAT family N-acetyltransferase [Cyclobacteriaceae bacterium]
MIRPYTINDREQVVAVFKQNVPKYFDADEEADLLDYLHKHGDTYFVMEDGGQIIGCGGYHLNALKTFGRISWDFFSPDQQGKGLGKQMVQHCLDSLREIQTLKLITVWTSQLAFSFYAKFGFRQQDVIPNYWGPGLDLYRMDMLP